MESLPVEVQSAIIGFVPELHFYQLERTCKLFESICTSLIIERKDPKLIAANNYFRSMVHHYAKHWMDDFIRLTALVQNNLKFPTISSKILPDLSKDMFVEILNLNNPNPAWLVYYLKHGLIERMYKDFDNVVLKDVGPYFLCELNIPNLPQVFDWLYNHAGQSLKMRLRLELIYYGDYSLYCKYPGEIMYSVSYPTHKSLFHIKPEMAVHLVNHPNCAIRICARGVIGNKTNDYRNMSVNDAKLLLRQIEAADMPPEELEALRGIKPKNHTDVLEMAIKRRDYANINKFIEKHMDQRTIDMLLETANYESFLLLMQYCKL